MDKDNRELAKYTDYLIENGAVVLEQVVTNTIGSLGIPILSNSIMVYKQHRFQTNVKVFMNEMKNEVKDIEEQLQKLNSDQLEFLRESILPITLDYIINEKQKKKIKYYFNGFKNILNTMSYIEVNQQIDPESLIILYFDTLKDLTLFDIMLFKEVAVKEKYVLDQKARELNGQDLMEVTTKLSIDKLKGLSLILRPLTIGEMGGEGEYTVNISDIKITAAGEKFYSFISE
jgi:hypothetical protein